MENLFQSIVREIIKGDNGSVKGLRILLEMLNEKEKEKLINSFKEFHIFKEEILIDLNKPDFQMKPTKTNIFRFARILFTIFVNPYRIDLKGKKEHSYEITGAYAEKFRKLFF